ncbi:MAG: alpha/beta hydrolase [Myxococcaceae bacterium]|nr:MAG: alpha/beta hydrolase [Myxococcaceae bacterium]
MLVALLALLTASDGGLSELEEFRERVNRPVALTVPGTHRVQILSDRPYGPGDKAHRFDAYLPERRDRRAAVVVLVHGGVSADVPFRPKDWGLYRSWGRLLAASGFVAIAFNHRLSFPDPMLAEADQDLTAMLQTVRAQSRTLGADPSRIALVAFSGGGPLLSRPLREELPGVRALAGFYPFLDPRKSALHQRFLKPDALTAFSPAAQLRTPVARRMPFFLARAGKDAIPDILPGIDAFVAESLAAGTPLTLFNHPEAPHGFDQEAGPRTREVLLAFLAFLQTHLAERPPS